LIFHVRENPPRPPRPPHVLFPRNRRNALSKALAKAEIWRPRLAPLIPTLIDQNSCAHLRMPSEMMRHGLSIRVFQA
jgi:hypothetical protein